MNTIHNIGENDKPLNDGLDKLSHAYRQLPDAEPPELLDQAILNSAHRAVEKKPHWMKLGWLQGLTTAAVVVLAISLILNQREMVPVHENGIRVNEPGELQLEKAAKKQLQDIQTDDLRTETKEKSENRQDTFRSAPVSGAADSGSVDTVASDQVTPPATGALRSQEVREALPAKAEGADKDISSNQPVLEELLMDEADLKADTAKFEAFSRPSEAAAIAEPSAAGVAAPAIIDPQIEQELLAIIKLKQSGDPAWFKELELFKQNHPDYPLPDAFSD